MYVEHGSGLVAKTYTELRTRKFPHHNRIGTENALLVRDGGRCFCGVVRSVGVRG